MCQGCLGGRRHGRRVGLLRKPVRRRGRDEPPRGCRRVLFAWVRQPQLRPPARSAGDGILLRRPPASRDPALPGERREVGRGPCYHMRAYFTAVVTLALDLSKLQNSLAAKEGAGVAGGGESWRPWLADILLCRRAPPCYM